MKEYMCVCACVCVCVCQVLKRVADKGELVSVALNTHGTRAVQKLIETLSSREQKQIVIDSLQNGEAPMHCSHTQEVISYLNTATARRCRGRPAQQLCFSLHHAACRTDAKQV